MESQIILERDREAAAARYKKVKTLCIPVYILTGACFVGTFITSMFGAAILTVICIFAFPIFIIATVACQFISGNAYKKYNALVKETIMLSVMNEVFTVVSYKPNETLQDELFYSSNLFPRFDRVQGNDLIEAVYGDLHFTMSDFELSERYRRNKHTHYRTVFQGRVIILHNRKNHQTGETVMCIPEASVMKAQETSGGVIKCCIMSGEYFIAWATSKDIAEADISGKKTTEELKAEAKADFAEITAFFDRLSEREFA
jgi:hypothetical protein